LTRAGEPEVPILPVRFKNVPNIQQHAPRIPQYLKQTNSPARGQAIEFPQTPSRPNDHFQPKTHYRKCVLLDDGRFGPTGWRNSMAWRAPRVGLLQVLGDSGGVLLMLGSF